MEEVTSTVKILSRDGGIVFLQVVSLISALVAGVMDVSGRKGIVKGQGGRGRTREDE